MEGLVPRKAPTGSCSVSIPPFLCYSLILRRIGVGLEREYSFGFCCCSAAHLCLTLCDPMDCSTPGFLSFTNTQKLAQTHVHWVSDAIQPSHLLSSPSSAFSLSQHQGLFQSVSSLHQVAKVLEFQLQHQSFQQIFRISFRIGLISFHSKGLSRVFSNTTVQKHRFFSIQPSWWSNSHIHTWLLEKP